MKILGLPKNTKCEKYNGLLSRYHLYFDKYLVIGRVAIQRIPCFGFFCREKNLFHGKLMSKQVSNQGFREIKISIIVRYLGEYNDWCIVDIVNKSTEDDSNLEELKKDVIIGVQD